MKQLLVILFIISGLLNTTQIFSQDENQINFRLTLDEVIEIAKKQSLNAFRAKNMYLADYWQYRSFKAELLPSLSLNATPLDYYQGIQSYRDNNGNNRYSYREYYETNGTLDLSQQFKYTGGIFFLESSANYLYDKSNDFDNSYYANPILSIAYRQSNIKYNSLKWTTKLEPLAYEKAKLDYISNAENIANTSVSYFFNLVSAQIKLNIATTNYNNADTLYRIAKGRFEIGTITQDELLDLELGLLNAKSSLTRSNFTLKRAQKVLNTFLRLDQEIIIECIIPKRVPNLDVIYEDALSKAVLNNPLIKEIKIANIEANRNVAETNSKRNFTGSFTLKYGLTSNDVKNEFYPIYEDPNRYERASISFNIPILDWGVRKGNYLQAKSNRAVIKLQNEQRWITFEQELFMEIMSFNIQDEQVAIAAKADTVAQMGYKVTKQRFFIDKVDVIRLNEARKSLEQARSQYVTALQTYWNSYYTIRKETLYDFEKDQPLIIDFDRLLEEATY